MENCIFCRIARHESPACMIAEDEHTCCFLDIARDVEGHMVVIPRKHTTSLLDCDGYEGVNLLNASGECAGQSVPHLHMHLIPRKPGDGIDAWPALPGTDVPLASVHDRLRVKDGASQ